MKIIFLLTFLALSFFAEAHEGHEDNHVHASENVHELSIAQEGRPTTWIQWIGSFHFSFLHFPIALINLLAISEFFLFWLQRPIFEYASRFLMLSAAILAPPTALLGFIYSYSAPYDGLMATFLWWHMWLGISAALLAVFVAFIRETRGLTAFYYLGLFVLFLLVNSTSFFGGGMTFGPFHLLPPKS